MLGFPAAHRRLPLTVATVVALFASMTTASISAATPSPSSPRPATPVKSQRHDLMAQAAGQHLLPRSMGKPAPARGEPGGTSTRAGLPRHGRQAFLLELSTSSTLRAYRLARPKGPTAASRAARLQFDRVKAAQAAVVDVLPAGARVLYRTHSVLAGVAVIADAAQLPSLRGISGVRAVHPITSKRISNAYAVPLQRAPEAWTAYGELGQHATIAVIDTGIDFTHSNFGGPGTSAAYNTAFAHDAEAADPALFPSAKIVNGYDLAGDDYDADPSSATYQPVPHPDANPLDCDGHGSHVAGTAAGFGVDSGGATFAGPYNSGTPFGSLRIGPGMAPRARLLAYKVFGCEGSTDLVADAIDLAGDPNGDGDPADRADVINMSLGSDFGSPDDADSVATNAAAELGISVVAASGNGGDYYDIGGSPGNAVRAIAVANSVDASSQLDHVHVSAPAGIVGDYGATRSVAYDWSGDPDLSGSVVALTDSDNKDACSPLSSADAALVSGKVAFVEWTDDSTVRRCGSASRAANLVSAGAAGFIFADDQETFAAGITGSATIPGVLVIKSAGDAIRAALGDGVTVSGTGAADFAQVVTADNDKVNTSSSRGVHGSGNVKPDVTAVGTSVFSTSVGTGNEGASLTGTSMAAPMVAGLSALVRSMHPNWSPEEVKADIMNTAGQDLYVGDNHTGAAYAPNRVGAGRIDAKAALDNTVLAYVQDDPGAVSVSFGPLAVTAATTLTKTIKLVNKELDAASYTTSYEAASTVPGVTFTVSPSTVTVPARSTQTVTLSLVIADPAALTKTIDPTVSRTQAGLPREYIADASGRAVFTPTSGSAPDLRVPVYAAPRPASVMTQPAAVTMPVGDVQHGTIPLSGQGVSQGAGDEAIQSIVAGFELQATSGQLPSCSATVLTRCVHIADERAADLRYVGATSDAPQQGTPMNGLAYFAVSTHAPWRTVADVAEFDVWIDSTGDGNPDVVLYNTRLSGQDVFVSVLVDLNTGDVLDIEAIDNELGNVDTANIDGDTMVLPVAIAALPGIGTGHSRIRYGVATFGFVVPDVVDLIGLDDSGDLVNPLTLDVLTPGVMVHSGNGGLLYQDLPNTSLTVTRNRVAYGADGGRGVLMVHLHNRVGSKAQVMLLKSPSQVSLRISPRISRLGTSVTATITVANTAGPVPTGTVVLRHLGGGNGFVVAHLTNGTARITLRPRAGGVYLMRADYLGNGTSYLPGASATVRWVVF